MSVNAADVRRYYGKYRGVVSDTNDTDQLGRVKVTLSDFPSLTSAWCMPCVPYAGKKMGWFFIPEVGANVWIEFEAGDINRPIWSGCFWDKDTIPDTASPSRKVLKTPTHQVVLDDLDGKAGQLQIESTVRSDQTVTLKFDKDGIRITAKSADVFLQIDNGITIKYPESKIELTAQQVQASEGEGTSLTLTAQEQTMKSSSITVQAANQLTVSASASTSVSSGQYTLKSNVITLQGTAINIG